MRSNHIVLTAAGSLKIVHAHTDDLYQILVLMQEASEWLLSRGIRQWRRMFTEEGRASVIERFATDEVYLVFAGTTAVATFSLRWEETRMWGAAGTDGQAGYLHGFTVSRKVAGLGVGSALLAWVEQQISTRERRYLRLNTAAENPGICGYYEREGFSSCGTVPYAGGGMTQLYERAIAR